MAIEKDTFYGHKLKYLQDSIIGTACGDWGDQYPLIQGGTEDKSNNLEGLL